MTSQPPPDGTHVIGSTDFDAPIESRYFEDYHVGAVYEYGYVSVSDDDIITFARAFDPQPFHVDREFALAGPFNGLIASGFHTNAIFMRLFADHFLSRVASLGSPGFDELRWKTPFRPGDALRLRTSIIEARASISKPDRGLVRTVAEMVNQNEDIVMSLTIMNLLRRRPEPLGDARPVGTETSR
jgi:acyl dehydratase